jgi:hypothetical protein
MLILLFISVVSGWINDEVRRNFCIAVTGDITSDCIDGVCKDSDKKCTEFDVQRAADLHRALRMQILEVVPQYASETVTVAIQNTEAVVVFQPISGGLRPFGFDFSAQLRLDHYSEFLSFGCQSRLIRERVPGSISHLFQRNARAVRALLELYLRVPGTCWTVAAFEPSQTTWIPDELDVFMSSPPHETIYFRDILAAQSVFSTDAMTEVEKSLFSSLKDKLRPVYSFAVARTITRLSDHEQELFGNALRNLIREIDLVLARGEPMTLVDGFGICELVEWVYELVVHATVLFRPPFQRISMIEDIRNANFQSPDLGSLFTTDHWLTGGIMAAFPDIDWSSRVDRETLISIVSVYNAAPFPISERIICLRVIHQMIQHAGIEAHHEVFEMIPPEWRDVALSFDAQSIHFLDTSRRILSALAQTGEATFHHMVAFVKFLTVLNLEQIEFESTDFRLQYEPRNPIADPSQFAISLLSSEKKAVCVLFARRINQLNAPSQVFYSRVHGTDYLDSSDLAYEALLGDLEE